MFNFISCLFSYNQRKNLEILWIGNNETALAIDKGVYVVRGQEELEKTAQENANQFPHKNKRSEKSVRYKEWFHKATPIVLHYIVLFILGLLTWTTLWFAIGEGWSFWKGNWFRLVLIASIAWASSIAFQAVTTLPQMLAPLIIGIIVRNIGYLDMREFVYIDAFLRNIYPVIILGKGPLLWNLTYMKENWLQIACLGALPWVSEVCTMMICMRYLLGHPWLYGLQFGCLFATIAGPVVVPVINVVTRGLKRKWVPLVGCAGGVDVALSVGVYGMVRSYMMAQEDSIYSYIKLVFTPFAGVGLGAAWGYLAGVIPHTKDTYVDELRVLFLVIPGTFANFLSAHLQWGGCAGIGILVCSAVAARQWVKKGWNHHDNPAVTAYRVMWSACEPVLFVYTGTYFVLNETTFHTLKYGIVILLICVTVRLIVASQVCWDTTWREKLFICCFWPCKTIVQAVICPLPLIATIMQGGSEDEVEYAEQVIVISIMAILIMTPTSFLATKYFGPILLRNKIKDDHTAEDETK